MAEQRGDIRWALKTSQYANAIRCREMLTLTIRRVCSPIVVSTWIVDATGQRNIEEWRTRYCLSHSQSSGYTSLRLSRVISDILKSTFDFFLTCKAPCRLGGTTVCACPYDPDSGSRWYFHFPKNFAPDLGFLWISGPIGYGGAHSKSGSPGFRSWISKFGSIAECRTVNVMCICVFKVGALE